MARPPGALDQRSTVQTDAVSATRRLLAIAADACSDKMADLASIWHGLISRRLRVVDHFSTDERHYVLLSRADGTPPLDDKHVRVLERILLGEQQKAIAMDLQLTNSSIASQSANALRGLGVNCVTSRAPVLLNVLAHAHYDQTPIRHGRVCALDDPEHAVQVLSTPIPEVPVHSALSPAEHAVLRMRADGKSHAEIALLRGASQRTVANQLASASRKLGISGRSELLSLLSRGGIAAQTGTSEPDSKQDSPSGTGRHSAETTTSLNRKRT